ncbi:SH3 domain-containing protein [Psychromarinibacter sp. S121]|uniref:SH3 domain-containing protein n=1 Tax=Psychromarinibacter sp. S121 TaxID=3415127 RepID=UPI003C7DBCE4
MKRLLSTTLGVVIVGAMLFFGEDAPETDATTTANAPEPADVRPDRLHTAAELSALLAEIKAQPEPEGPRIRTPHPDSAEPVAEAVPEPVHPASPDEIPMAIESLPLGDIPAERLPVMEATYTTAPNTSVEDAAPDRATAPTLDVSRVPVPRPAPRPTGFVPVEPVATALAGPEVLPPSLVAATQTPPAPVTTTDAELVALALAEALDGARPELMYVTEDGAILRSAPHEAAERILQLYRGDETEVLFDMGDGWLRVREISTGETGFVPARVLSGSQQ